jgi:hypothetical protein
MSGLRRGIVSFALAGAVATGGFIGGVMLSGGAASAATGGAHTALTGTTVAATPSASATPKTNDGRRPCPHHSSSASATNTRVQ